MEPNQIRWFNKPKNGLERKWRLKVMKELASGEPVGIIHGEHEGHIAFKLYSVGRGLKVKLFDNEIYVSISHAICDEIYEAVRIRCELLKEDFCPLPFKISQGDSYRPPPPGKNGLHNLESVIDSQKEKFSFYSSESGIVFH